METQRAYKKYFFEIIQARLFRFIRIFSDFEVISLGIYTYWLRQIGQK
jgi:hypothetical protein